MFVVGQRFVWKNEGQIATTKVVAGMPGFHSKKYLDQFNADKINHTNNAASKINDEFIFLGYHKDITTYLILYSKLNDITGIFGAHFIPHIFILKTINYNDYWAKLNE